MVERETQDSPEPSNTGPGHLLRDALRTTDTLVVPGVANALFEHLSRKLPISRLQRDLSDSTVERTFGTAFAHSLIGYNSLLRGFSKISVNQPALRDAVAFKAERVEEIRIGDHQRHVDAIDVGDAHDDHENDHARPSVRLHDRSP